jgi:ribosome biogenesis GTPase A
LPSGKFSARGKGNVAKATPLTRLRAQLKAIDLIVEVRDARVPHTSRHPNLQELMGNKPGIVVLAKQDLADEDLLKPWLDKLKQTEHKQALPLSLKTQSGRDKLLALALRQTRERQDALTKRGLLPRAIRVCVVGLPNVGKSTLINWLVGRHKAPTGNAPGITRGAHWIRIHPQIELLDSPGLLPPVSFSAEPAMKLALCNLLPQDHYDLVDAADWAMNWFVHNHPEALDVYEKQFAQNKGSLQNLAEVRSCLLPGGKPDVRRAASILVNDFRNGKLGRYVLDTI